MSDGVATILQLLAADSGVTALVPVGASPPRLAAGVIAQGALLPWLSVICIASTDRNIPSPGATRHVNDLVQVTCAVKTYPEIRSLMDAVRLACADKFPTVSGISNVTVHTAGAGPDGMDAQARYYMKTQDFRVRYLQPTS